MPDLDIDRRELGGTVKIRYKEIVAGVHVPYVETWTAGGAGGGGTQYAEDTASAAAELLTMAGVVRKDSAASLVDADGDRTVLQVDSTGALRTTGGGGGGGGVVQQGAKDGTAQAWLVDGSAITQPVSAVALPLPAGAATEATLAALSAKLPAALVGGRLDVSIGASPATVPVSGTFWQATQPVSAAALPLPAGAATEATLGTRLAEATFTARINTLGQKTMANSTPVTLASDQTALAITAAALPLPTGAATEATLATRLAEATFTGRINTQGQKAMAASTPIVIASDQSAVPVSGTVTANVASTTITATVTPAGDDLVADGRDVVTTAGTRVQMTSQACKVVAVTAETDNTGLIVIGSVTVVAAIATRRGLPLSAGDTATFTVDNVNRLFIDATVSSDGVTWAILA